MNHIELDNWLQTSEIVYEEAVLSIEALKQYLREQDAPILY